MSRHKKNLCCQHFLVLSNEGVAILKWLDGNGEIYYCRCSFLVVVIVAFFAVKESTLPEFLGKQDVVILKWLDGNGEINGCCCYCCCYCCCCCHCRCHCRFKESTLAEFLGKQGVAILK